MYAFIGWLDDPSTWKVIELNPKEKQNWITVCNVTNNLEDRKVYLHTIPKENESKV